MAFLAAAFGIDAADPRRDRATTCTWCCEVVPMSSPLVHAVHVGEPGPASQCGRTAAPEPKNASTIWRGDRPCGGGCFGLRASDKGFLPISVTTYLELLDWTGRRLRSDKVGSLPDHLCPIHRRTGVDACGWCEVVSKFGRIFKRAAGTS